MSARNLPVLIVAGFGNGGGTGVATARLFAKSGYRVAVVARKADKLTALSEIIKADGGEAAPFPVHAYTYDSMKAVFASINITWPDSPIRAAVWNAGSGVWKPFLETTETEFQESVNTSIIGPAAFARECILAFKDLEVNEVGKKGMLIFTGATASIRGSTMASAFAAGKHGLRGLSQSLAKEFGKEKIHIAHAIIGGGILVDEANPYVSKDKLQDAAAMVNDEKIAKAYLFLAGQDQTTFTGELDLRPAHEKC